VNEGCAELRRAAQRHPEAEQATHTLARTMQCLSASARVMCRLRSRRGNEATSFYRGVLFGTDWSDWNERAPAATLVAGLAGLSGLVRDDFVRSSVECRVSSVDGSEANAEGGAVKSHVADSSFLILALVTGPWPWQLG